MNAEEWNRNYPVGTKVIYHPTMKPGTNFPLVGGEPTATRGEAWTIGGGEAIVQVEGRAGGVALSHLQIVAEMPS